MAMLASICRLMLLLSYVAALQCHVAGSPATHQIVSTKGVKDKTRSIADILQTIRNGLRNQRTNGAQRALDLKDSSTDNQNSEYAEWTEWSKCSRKCRQRRFRRCLPGSLRNCKDKKQVRQCTGHRCTAPGTIPEERRSSNKTASATKNFKVLYHLQPFVYGPWSEWTPCTKNCRTRRYRPCVMPLICGKTVLQEDALCYAEGSTCEILYKPKTDTDEIGMLLPIQVDLSALAKTFFLNI